MDDATFHHYLRLADGVGSAARTRLINSGITSIAALDSKTDSELLAIEGIGCNILKKLRHFSEWYHKKHEKEMAQ